MGKSSYARQMWYWVEVYGGRSGCMKRRLTCAYSSYLEGWATQETNWTGANITHYSWGRGYTRDEAWGFEITSMIG
jgi:hypothetical protein